MTAQYFAAWYSTMQGFGIVPYALWTTTKDNLVGYRLTQLRSVPYCEGVASCAASREATSSNTSEGYECLQILPHNASLQWAKKVRVKNKIHKETIIIWIQGSQLEMRGPKDVFQVKDQDSDLFSPTAFSATCSNWLHNYIMQHERSLKTYMKLRW